MSDLFEQIKSGEYQIIIVNSRERVIFQTKTSPVSRLCNIIVNDYLDFDDTYTIYTYQLGTALATISRMMHIDKIVSMKLSEPGKVLLDKYGVDYTYLEMIDYVKSSKDETKVCGVEKALCGLENEKDRINYLKELGENATMSCSVV